MVTLVLIRDALDPAPAAPLPGGISLPPGPPTSAWQRRDRGSALIIAMILMVVLAVVGLALVKRTTREVDAVASKRHWDRAMSCAEGARQMLLSQFRAFGVSVTGLQLSRVIGDQQYASGHYDTFPVTSVSAAGGTPGNSVSSNAANSIGFAGRGLGGRGYRFTVVCSDSTGSTHQQEVEFLVNFGF